MIVEEVVGPLVDKFGPTAGHEILIGAEATRAVFKAGDAHMLGLARAFDGAAGSGHAVYGLSADIPDGDAVTPATAEPSDGPFRVGGIGLLTMAAAFAAFPKGSVGRKERAA